MLLAIFMVVGLSVAAIAQEQGEAPTGVSANKDFPRFRVLDQDAASAPDAAGRSVVLLTDRDYAPWSFFASGGQLQGISVDLAKAACAELGLACDLKPMPFAELRSAMARGEGDAIISGLRYDAANPGEFLSTRPYFLSLGRFVVRQGTSLPSTDPRALAGKRLGFVRNSAHGAFLQANFGKSALTAYDKLSSLQEALRTGAIDAAFADAVAMAFWIKGSASRSCCQMFGNAFVDRSNISRGLFFVVKPAAADLRDVFDAALDQLEEKGETARIFMRYLPMQVW
jgi:polar amino acid transport system substrate-binding protein